MLLGSLQSICSAVPSATPAGVPAARAARAGPWERSPGWGPDRAGSSDKAGSGEAREAFHTGLQLRPAEHSLTESKMSGTELCELLVYFGN